MSVVDDAARAGDDAPMPDRQRLKIKVCTGTGCLATGSMDVAKALREELAKRSAGGVASVEESACFEQPTVGITGCQRLCAAAPLVKLDPLGVTYCHVRPKDVPELIEETVLGGKIVERLLFEDPMLAQRFRGEGDIPFFSKQGSLSLRRCGDIDPENIEEFLEVGGYQGLTKALHEMTREEVVDAIKASGIQGRGGGGFPTGLKWQFVKDAPGDVKYVVCNGDEGDPGAFMDGSVMEGDPHSVIEGMAIAAYAIGANRGVLYVRAEYPRSVRRLQMAMEQARAAGYLGESVAGSGFAFDLSMVEGAGAFVCGEETALLRSIEGQRGMPRPRPPYPAVSGLWGKPTLINNVETYANIGNIIRDGSDSFAAIGTKLSKGTKTFALTGEINNIGLVEVPLGITLREVILDIGGGLRDGKTFKAAQTGGPSGGCIPASHLDTPIDYKTLNDLGSMMGSGGLVVMDEGTCMVNVAKFFLGFCVEESCGKCPPCRIGTQVMLNVLQNICEGKGRSGDIELLEQLGAHIKLSSLCGLGQTAPNPTLSTLRYFREEYEEHILQKHCPAGECYDLVEFFIEESLCNGCHHCARSCPVEAIAGDKKQVHTIDSATCINCGACLGVCPTGAVKVR